MSETIPSFKDLWLEKIHKELKGKELADFDYVWDGLKISPFTTEATKGKTINSPDKATNKWQIGSFLEKDSADLNNEILIALNEGAQAIYLQVDQKINWAAIFDKVHLDWINIHLDFNDLKWSKSFILFLSTNYDLTTLKGSFKSGDNLACFHKIHSVLPGFACLHYDISCYDSSDLMAAKLFSVRSDIEYLSQKHEIIKIISAVQWTFTASQDLILNISVIRAWKLLWHLLMQSAETDIISFPKIIAQVRSDRSSDETDNMIASGLSAVSMILGGVDTLFIENPSSLKNKNRYGRMVQSIFDSESYLGHVVDPMAGSFVIERMTQTIAKSVWDKYLKLSEN